MPESSVRGTRHRDLATCAVARGEPVVRVLPDDRGLANEPAGKPVPDSKGELPPVIRRAEVVAFALVALLVICVVAVLYAAKAFFLPVVTAFVVGTMLSPAAGFLERHRIPRAVSAVLIVTAVGAGVAFIVGLISFPADGMEQPPAGARIAAEGQIACLRPAAGAVAAAAEHARRLRHALDIPDAEIRLGPAGRGIPVADLHRIPAVLRHADPVHRELEETCAAR